MAKTSYITANGMMLGEVTNGVMRNYGTDALGSVVATYSNGALENTYAYKPYGSTLAKTGTVADPSFLWNGGRGYRAVALQMATHYVRARHYSAVSSQWTTVDSVWPRQPPYSYVNGRVINFVDPSGRKICNPKPTCTSIKGVFLGAPSITGVTDCCVDQGTIYTLICTDNPCLLECNIAHENVHAQDLAQCCALAGKCYANAKGGVDCNGTYVEWQKRNADKSECNACAVSSACFLSYWAGNCLQDVDAKIDQKGVSQKNTCCADWFTGYFDDSRMEIDSCAQAQLWKNSHYDLACPFDSNGNVRRNWK
jgi:RHS repeat-associated protein